MVKGNDVLQGRSSVAALDKGRALPGDVAPAVDRGKRRAIPWLAMLIALAAAATLVTVWAIEHAGYVPCELCLAERNPYYVGVPVALLTAWAASQARWRWARAGFALAAVVFIASAALAAYHAGVEWKMWNGPTGCAGPLTAPTSVTDFMTQLKTVKVVRCDAPALVVFGLSLAGWNVLLSLVLAALSVQGARVAGAALSAETPTGPGL